MIGYHYCSNAALLDVIRLGALFNLPRWEVRYCILQRRRWDLNPRKVALHTISNRADSAALALLQVAIFTLGNEYRLARLPEVWRVGLR